MFWNMLRYFDKCFNILHFKMQCDFARMVVWAMGDLVSKSSDPNATGKCPIMFEESVRNGENGTGGLVKQVGGDLYSGTPDHYHP